MKNSIAKIIKKNFDFKLFIKFIKARIFVYFYVFISAFLIIDVIGWAYWQYAILFVPINMIINFLVYKRTFQ